MADGLRSPEKLRVSRRGALRGVAGFALGAGAAWAARSGILRPLFDSPKDLQVEPRAEEGSLMEQRFNHLKGLFFSEINPDANLEVVKLMEDLTNDESGIKKHFFFRDSKEEEEVEKETYFSIEGQQGRGSVPPIQDIGSWEEATSEGKVLRRRIGFYVNSGGEIVTTQRAISSNNLTEQQLKDLAKVVLKKTPHDLQWQTEPIDEEGWTDGMIAWTVNEEKYNKRISLEPDGKVVIDYNFKTEY